MQLACSLCFGGQELLHESKLLRPQLTAQGAPAQHDPIRLAQDVINIAQAGLIGNQADAVTMVTLHHEASEVLHILSCLNVGG